MRCIYVITIFLTLSLLSCAPSGTMPMPKAHEHIKYEPMEPLVWKLPNGLKVIYMEDKELPLVQGALYIPRGTLWERDGDGQVVAAMGYMLRQGGTKTLKPDDLDFRLEKLAASIDSGYSSEFGSVGFSCLSSDFEEVFSIFSDILLNPNFAQSRLDLWKGQMLESIRRRTDDPGTVASISFKSLVFGDSPFGRSSTSKDIKSIKRSDLFKAYNEFIVPDGSYLAIVGNVDKDLLDTTVKKYLSVWQGSPSSLDREPAFSYSPEKGIYFIDQPLEQATIYIGQQGPARLPPDYVAIEAFNSIFGAGDFGARLFRTIRTEKGLAYALYGASIHSFLVGQNIIVIKTKSESTGQAIIESLKILQGMQQKEVEHEELELAKQAIRSSFIFKIDTPEAALKRYVMLKLLDYPEDYDQTYMDKVDSLNLKDIKNAANRYWDLNDLVIVVVGDKRSYNALKDNLDAKQQFLDKLHLKRCSFVERLEECV